MNEKYGYVSKKFVTGESSKTKDIERTNIGNLYNKQLKDKIQKIEIKTEVEGKNNKIGKVGIKKYNKYTLDKYAPKTICVKCGRVNHLSTKYKYVQMPMPIPTTSMSTIPAMQNVPNMFNQNYNSMSFIPNPYTLHLVCLGTCLE